MKERRRLKDSYKRILHALKDGGRVWYPPNSVSANISIGFVITRCKVETLKEMETLGLIQLKGSGNYSSDTYALLPSNVEAESRLQNAKE